MTALLDNKARFSEYAESLGLQMPAHHVVASPEYLKSLNNSKNVRPIRAFSPVVQLYFSVQHALYNQQACCTLRGCLPKGLQQLHMLSCITLADSYTESLVW
jgi:hypothetical protein